MNKWLHLAAAPTFALMALMTSILDSGTSHALCSGGANFGLGGMAPMYFADGRLPFHAMAEVYVAPTFLNAVVTLFVRLDRSSDIQPLEQKP
jgi:hypothetical protein